MFGKTETSYVWLWDATHQELPYHFTYEIKCTADVPDSWSEPGEQVWNYVEGSEVIESELNMWFPKGHVESLCLNHYNKEAWS